MIIASSSTNSKEETLNWYPMRKELDCFLVGGVCNMLPCQYATQRRAQTACTCCKTWQSLLRNIPVSSGSSESSFSTVNRWTEKKRIHCGSKTRSDSATDHLGQPSSHINYFPNSFWTGFPVGCTGLSRPVPVPSMFFLWLWHARRAWSESCIQQHPIPGWRQTARVPARPERNLGQCESNFSIKKAIRWWNQLHKILCPVRSFDRVVAVFIAYLQCMPWRCVWVGAAYANM